MAQISICETRRARRHFRLRRRQTMRSSCCCRSIHIPPYRKDLVSKSVGFFQYQRSLVCVLLDLRQWFILMVFSQVSVCCGTLE
ncbi:hypothetical protein BGW80DRAFT_1212122 [Lactifluus volemus]|nr:hypothetical protein BGW80DRAFT_1212122 [Lactifluus volemus]